MGSESNKRTDVYADITTRVLASIEAGVAPWTQPWVGGMPRNALSGKSYRGINPVLLTLTTWRRGYRSPMWLTFKQAHHVAARAARAAGRKVVETSPGRFVFGDGDGCTVGGIRKGQNAANGTGGTAILFWKAYTPRNAQDPDERRLVARAYHVFNLEQCDEHVQAFVRAQQPSTEPFNPIETADQICEGFKVETVHGGDMAAYRPSTDTIFMPQRETFVSPSAYYSTRFHEMGHATGHTSRLARKGITDAIMFGSHTYSEEELVAEFTACFLCGEAGIVRETEQRSASYLRMWSAKLREAPRLLVTAAAQAQRAADYVLGRKWESEAAGDDTAEAA